MLDNNLVETDSEHREAAWRIGIGLQNVNNLKPSVYLVDIANQNISGSLSIADAVEAVEDHYRNIDKNCKAYQNAEADIVAARISREIQSQEENYSPEDFIDLHFKLFEGIYSKCSEVKNENLKTKVYFDIEDSLNFDFQEFEAKDLIEHTANFVFTLWADKYFTNGNTRLCAVFMIRFLDLIGMDYLNYQVFEKHSLYFKNALFSAKPCGCKKVNTHCLELFLENFIFGANNKLCYDCFKVNKTISPKEYISHSVANVQLSKNETKVLEAIQKNPEIKQEELARIVKVSLRTTKSITKSLVEKGFIERANGKRFGYWEIKILK